MAGPALRRAIEAAAARLDEGRLVAFPTETVYGLGADATNDDAVARIFEAKGRPSDHPLIVHVPVGIDPLQWAAVVPPMAQRLIDRWWPGPLTLILPRRAGMGEAAAGGQDSIGLRCPGHPVAQALLLAYHEKRDARDRHAPIGIAAPSANRFGRISPTQAAHVLDEFGSDASLDDEDAKILVVDGGPCDVGIESTIIDCSRPSTGPVLLRPGAITAAMIEETIGIAPHPMDRDAPRASGTLEAHYAPIAPLRLVDAIDLDGAPDDVAVWTWSTPADSIRTRWRVAPGDAHAYAHELYATLRTLDASGAREIWIERPPPDWIGVNDRLRRAAATTRS